VKQRKPLSPNALLGVIIGGVILVGMAGWFLLVHPQGSKLSDLKRQTVDVQPED